MKKNLLIGSFGAQNIGDELILLTALQKHKNALVMTNNPDDCQFFCEMNFSTIASFPTGVKSLVWFLLQPKKWKKYFALQKQIKKIIFAGGGLFSAKPKAVFIWAAHVFWCKFFMPDKKIVFKAQGVDVPNSKLVQALTRWSFNQASIIEVRDEVSAKNLQIMGCKKPIKTTNDAVIAALPKLFTVPKITPKKRIVIQAAKPFNAVALRSQIANRFPQHKIAFMAFDKNDIAVIAKATNLQPNQIIFADNLPALINELRQTDIFIGQRFHFLALAHYFSGAQNTFLLEQPYAPKTKTLAQTLGLKIFL